MRARSPRKDANGKAAPPTVADLLPARKRKKYLDLLRARTQPGEAARAVGLTGSQIRSLRRRDPAFAAEFDEAWGEGENHYEERLSKLAETRAETSDRILEVELATHGGPKYAHLRRDRVKIEGRVEHALVIDPSKLALLSDAELDAFERALRKLADEEAAIDVEAVEVRGEIGTGADESG